VSHVINPLNTEDHGKRDHCFVLKNVDGVIFFVVFVIAVVLKRMVRVAVINHFQKP